jgi:excisionase family DNA binding protein
VRNRDRHRNGDATAEGGKPSGSSAELLTIEEVAARLTICKRTVERLIAREEFAAPLKIGRASRFHPADVTRYLEKLRRARGDRIGTS